MFKIVQKELTFIIFPNQLLIFILFIKKISSNKINQNIMNILTMDITIPEITGI